MSESSETKLEQEIASLRDTLGGMATSIHAIEVMLAKMEGQNLAGRIYQLEVARATGEKYQAQRDWIPEAVSNNRKKLEELENFKYKLMGVLVVGQVLFTGAGVALMKWLYAATQTQ